MVILPAADAPFCSLSSESIWRRELEDFRPFLSNRCGVFADATGEDQGIDPVEAGAQCQNGFGQPIAEYVDGQVRPAIAVIDGLHKGAHVIAQAGNAEQAAFTIQNVRDPAKS